MDFFARQEQSRRRTRYLVILFALAFIAVGVAVATVVAFLFEYLPSLDTATLSTTMSGGRSGAVAQTFFATIGIVLLLMLIASAGRTAMLSRGGASVARMLGATEVHADSTDLLHRRLSNVVEEMAIAAGIPVPDIFVLEAESGINAFAAGLEQSDAAVAVTRGALERLSRAELQGVIAHEFSHILNGDMRINQRLIGFSFGILVLAMAGRWLLHSTRLARSTRNKGAAIGVILGLALLILGSIGIFFGRLIKAAVSRQREMLADASAVQFTREPEGLAGALKKIGGFTTEFRSAEVEEVAHMLFGRGSRAFRGWFATHPPILERIRALEPGFSAADLQPLPETLPSVADDHEEHALSAAAPFDRSGAEISVAAAGQIESAGVGSQLHAAIPEDLHAAAHSHEASWLLVLALVCAGDRGFRQSRRAFLEQRLGRQRTQLCLRLADSVAALDIGLRLPLLELCMPALRQRPDTQLQFLLELVGELTLQRSSSELFDFVLPRVLTAWLGRRVEIKPPRRSERMRRSEALNVTLATVASYGHGDSAAAEAAYRAGLQAADARDRLKAMPIAAHDPTLLQRLDTALDSLRHVPARAKRGVLEAVLVTIRHDRTVSIEETELFRAIAATLDVPAPPLPSGRVMHRCGGGL